MSKPPDSETTAPRSAQRLDVAALLTEAMERQIRKGASFQSLTVDALAREAGISRSSFYLRFKDKNELLAHLLERVASEIGDAAGAWFAHPESTGPINVTQAVEGIVNVFERHSAVMQAAIETSGQDPKIDTIYRNLLRDLLRANRLVVHRAAAAGRTRPDLSVDVGDALVWMIERCSYQLARASDTESRQRMIKALSYVVWHSLFEDKS